MSSDHAGMVPAAEWAQTDIHAASIYLCGRCGLELADPQDLYVHLEFCDPEDIEISEGSVIRLTKAVGTIEKIDNTTAHVRWDSGARSSVPIDWLTRK